VQAGEARRAKAAAAAMCPAVSDSSGSVANRTTARQGLPVGWYTDRNGGQSPESCADSSPQRPEQSFRPEDTPDRGSQGSSGGGTADGLMQYAAACADIEPFLATGGRRLLEQCQARKAYISPSSSTKFTATTRQLLVDWAMLRQQRLKLSDSTMHLAVHLADEMLAVKVSSGHWLGLGLPSVCTASSCRLPPAMVTIQKVQLRAEWRVDFGTGTWSVPTEPYQYHRTRGTQLL